MKRIGIFLSAALFCSACVKTRYVTSEKIVTKDSVVVKDTTIYIKLPSITLPGDTVKLVEKVPCPEVHWKGETKKGHIKIAAAIDSGKLTIECSTDSLMRENDSLKVLLKLKEIYQSKIIDRPPLIQVEYRIPWWAYVVAGMGVFLIVYAMFRK